MAKVHKVEFYLTDVNDMYETGEELMTEIENKLYDGFIGCPTWKTSEEFEWDDELAINKINCTKEDFEKYFTT